MELTGEGSCHGSFGELLQGVLPGNKKFLVNLKIKNASRACLRLMSSAYSNEKEEFFAESYRRYSKSYKVLRNILADIGRHDDCLLEIDSDIPVGKGCSSSTADMIASIQALAASLSLALKPDYIGRMLTEIEPNDGLHYHGTSVYHHTSGELIGRFNYVPPLHILGIDFGGVIDTVEFNRTPFTWTEAEMEYYAVLLEDVKKFLSEEDLFGLCQVATESALLWQKVKPKNEFDCVMRFMKETGGIGIVNTHSGTFLGVLYREGSADLSEILHRAEAALPGYAMQLFNTVSCATNSKKDHP
ncbi:MAG: kinase [Proteobacteria bacterium]|nr:kinase [Pseudomonadota bacterium]